MPAYPFKLYRRKRKNGQPVFYARYLKPDGTYTAGRSTGETVRRKAEAVAYAYMTGGKIATSNITTIKDLADIRRDADGVERAHFFDFDGPYIIENRRSAGKRISPSHCIKSNSILLNHVVRLMGNTKLSEINTASVKTFRGQLFREGFSGSTINKALGVLKSIIETADDQGLIRQNVRIGKASLQSKKRGILTELEVKQLFSKDWDAADPRAKAAAMLAAATGFRLGEIQGLRIKDVEPDRVTVYGTWSDSPREWRPGTKNGQPYRSVPIPPEVSRVLQSCIELNPWGALPDNYVFFSLKTKDAPITAEPLTSPFYKAMRDILGIDEAGRQARCLVFHSWRHFFNSLLVESRIPLQKIQALTGHLSATMTQNYYHTNDLSDVAEVQRNLFHIVSA